MLILLDRARPSLDFRWPIANIGNRTTANGGTPGKDRGEVILGMTVATVVWVVRVVPIGLHRFGISNYDCKN